MKFSTYITFVLAATALADGTYELPQDGTTGRAQKRIAIIGAGSAGTSTAYHLRRYSAAANIEPDITIYERAPYVGGRSITVDAWDAPHEPVELGASIFVAVNTILVDACTSFNLSVIPGGGGRRRQRRPRTLSLSDDNADEDETLGIWNGAEFVFTTTLDSSSRWRMWWNTLKLLWRYGWAPKRTIELMDRTVARFFRMYESPVFPWQSLSDAAAAVGLTAVTAETGARFLAAEGVGGLFADEVVQASTRVNYAQNLGRIHGLEAMVCMATDGAMAVDGGNWKIFESMAKVSGAAVRLNTSVTEVRLLKDGSYAVSSWDAHAGEGNKTETFDAVVLAAPWQFANISFTTTPAHVPDAIPYVSLHVTLFATPHRLSPEAFNMARPDSVPDVILTTLPPEGGQVTTSNNMGPDDFFSISTLRVAENPHTNPPRTEYIYKIFSPRPIKDTFLSLLLGDIPLNRDEEVSDDDVSWIHRKVWNSYPYLYPRVTFEEIKLDEGLWYTSGIESFISTMETSSLMGKNVARLIVDEWEGKNRDQQVDIESTTGYQQAFLMSEL